MNPLILELLDYHAWANERLLQHVSALPEGVFTAHVNNVFSSVAETFGHIAAVDEAWLSRMNGISPRAVETKRFANVQEAQDHFNDLHARIRRFLSGQDDPEKNHRVQQHERREIGKQHCGNRPAYRQSRHLSQGKHRFDDQAVGTRRCFHGLYRLHAMEEGSVKPLRSNGRTVCLDDRRQTSARFENLERMNRTKVKRYQVTRTAGCRMRTGYFRFSKSACGSGFSFF